MSYQHLIGAIGPDPAHQHWTRGRNIEFGRSHLSVVPILIEPR